MSEPAPSTIEPEELVLRLVLAMEALVATIARQSEAIDRLASSNEELVDALMQEEPEDDPAGIELDMSGRPLSKQ